MVAHGQVLRTGILSLKPFRWGAVQVDYKSWRNINVPTVHPAWNRTGICKHVEMKTRYIDNPYWSVYESYLEEDRDRLYGNVGVKITPASWLTVTGRINGDIYQYNAQDRIAVYSAFAVAISEYLQKYNEFNYELIATANKSWGVHSLVANLGTNYLQRSRRVSDIVTSGGLIIPNFLQSEQCHISTIIGSSTGIYNKALASVFGSFPTVGTALSTSMELLRNDYRPHCPKRNNSICILR